MVTFFSISVVETFYLQTLTMSLFFLIGRTCLYGRYHMYLQRVDVALFDLYLAYFELYCTRGIELIITRKVFTKLQFA